MVILHIHGVDNMLDGNIMIFAGLCLDKYKRFTSRDLQRFIRERPEVGKAVAIEKLDEVLDYMNYAKLLDVCGRQEGFVIYKRYS